MLQFIQQRDHFIAKPPCILCATQQLSGCPWQVPIRHSGCEGHLRRIGGSIMPSCQGHITIVGTFTVMFKDHANRPKPEWQVMHTEYRKYNSFFCWKCASYKSLNFDHMIFFRHHYHSHHGLNRGSERRMDSQIGTTFTTPVTIFVLSQHIDEFIHCSLHIFCDVRRVTTAVKANYPPPPPPPLIYFG